MPFTFKNINNPSIAICLSAVCAAALQCVLLRELLAVCAGNELVIGLALSLWLSFAGAGSLAGARRRRVRVETLAAAMVALAVFALMCIRASRLCFAPGELIGPFQVAVVCCLAEGPFAFVSGYFFGNLSTEASAKNSYGIESLGSLTGSLLAFICIVFYMPNAKILICAVLPLILILLKKPYALLCACMAIGLCIFVENPSLHWKYPFAFSGIIYGREGEIVKITGGADTTYMLSGSLYKATAQLPQIEQAVHIPMGQVSSPHKVLVICDKGHSAELSRYAGLLVDCIEPEPKLAAPGCTSDAVERTPSNNRYDVILVGSGLPQTTAANRMFTESFFRRMKAMMTDSGVFSFTVQLSENYLSSSEQRLYASLQATLSRVFKHVLIFPGNGYTFLGSSAPLTHSFKPRVSTRYLESSIVPSVSKNRITEANKALPHARINTTQRPIALVYELFLWLDQFKTSVFFFAGIVLFILPAGSLFLPKTIESLSMASTGFAAGSYSVALLLLYQSTFGTLYSRVSLMLMSLTIGFVIGSFVKKVRYSNALIGVYCFGSLGLLCVTTAPSALLFYFCHAIMGILVAAQFQSFKHIPVPALFAADLFGGALGMFLCSTLCIPLFGIVPTALTLCAMKLIIGMFDPHAGPKSASGRS